MENVRFEARKSSNLTKVCGAEHKDGGAKYRKRQRKMEQALDSSPKIITIGIAQVGFS